ncbi:MAG: hypothetical protein QM662_01790 [Gordonia sp. (in: high G+C Gram-positive bacteria)]
MSLREPDLWRGTISWPRLVAQGYSQADVRRLVAAGDLVALRRNWYATRQADPAVVEAPRRRRL